MAELAIQKLPIFNQHNELPKLTTFKILSRSDNSKEIVIYAEVEENDADDLDSNPIIVKFSKNAFSSKDNDKLMSELMKDQAKLDDLGGEIMFGSEFLNSVNHHNLPRHP